MSRKLALAATAALTVLVGGPAWAQSATAPADPVPAVPPQPADATTRAAYDRADPLSRSIFWAREQQINPMDPIAGVRTAQALRELGQHDKAAEAAEATLLVQPENIEAMLEAGRAHIARGQAFYGIARLEKARDLAPGDWRPLSLLGVAYQQVKRPGDAQAAWSRGLALSPENPNILANMAMALATAGDPIGAEGLLRRAAAQPEASLQVRQNLALVLGLQGKMAEAEAIIRRDLPPDQADRNLDWLRRQTGGGVAGAPRTWDSLQNG